MPLGKQLHIIGNAQITRPDAHSTVLISHIISEFMTQTISIRRQSANHHFVWPTNTKLACPPDRPIAAGMLINKTHVYMPLCSEWVSPPHLSDSVFVHPENNKRSLESTRIFPSGKMLRYPRSLLRFRGESGLLSLRSQIQRRQ